MKKTFEQHFELAMKVMDNLFGVLGVAYLFKPLETTSISKCDVVHVIDLLKHCYGLCHFIDILQFFLKRVTQFLNEKEHKISSLASENIRNSVDMVKVISEKYETQQNMISEIENLFKVQTEITNNYYYEKIFGNSLGSYQYQCPQTGVFKDQKVLIYNQEDLRQNLE